MRVLVTGGAGFAGSWFVRDALIGEYPYFAGADVTVFDKLTYAGSLDNLADVREHPRFRFVRVHVSTDEVYGPVPTGSQAHEDDPLRPTSSYAASKAAADLIARAYATSFGLDVRITRATNTYGPHQYPEKLIPLFVTRLLRGGGTELSNRDLTQRLLDATGRTWDDAVQQVPDPRGASAATSAEVRGWCRSPTIERSEPKSSHAPSASSSAPRTFGRRERGGDARDVNVDAHASDSLTFRALRDEGEKSTKVLSH